jgi:hypothetical protein
MKAKLLINFGSKLSFLLAIIGVGAAIETEGDRPDFQSDFYAAAFDHTSPAFTWFSVDSIGRGNVSVNTVLTAKRTSGLYELESSTTHRFSYVLKGPDQGPTEVWEINLAKNGMMFDSRYSEGAPPPALTLTIDQHKNHATLLGLLNKDGSIQLPAILHLPDHGSFRISSGNAAALGYAASNGNVEIIFGGATRQNPAVEYRCEVVSIYPKIAGIDADARFDGFRRNWLNVFQISPRWRMLANHADSDTCAFCYYEYADIAKDTPPLAKGLGALDVVRQSLDSIINGANAYGMPGHGAFPAFASDTLPSLLIAAHDCVEGGPGGVWLATNYTALKSWAETMLATDHSGDGLIEYKLSGNSDSWPVKLKYRPANWWDTIGFGHQDAYANALAYRALRGMEQLAQQSGHPDDQARYHAAADKLRGSYYKTFYDEGAGVLAGWRSADGRLHDYYFPWVNGIAIHYGLVPKKKANAIMDRLLAKMKEVGYTRFDLGLPGNLIPVARKDYVDHDPRYGGGAREDNSDGFQKYENGGATACFAYFTLAALYDLGRVEEADKMLFPMLEAFAKGDFQGRCDNGMSKDWKTWKGVCWGYEGFLADNYYAFLAILDRQAALKRGEK